MHTPVKRLIYLLLLMAVSTTGCLQMEHDLQIKPDGSATYQLEYAITEQAVTQFQALLTLRDDLAAAAKEAPDPDLHPILMVFLNPDLAAIREQAEALESFGVSLVALHESPRALWRQFSLTLAIKDMARLPDIPFFATHGFSLQRNAAQQYVLARPAIVDDPATLPPRFSEAELADIRPLLADFRAEVRIRVPGRIISTTAQRTAMQTATWNFTFARNPHAMHELLRQRFHLVFLAPEQELPQLPAPRLGE